LSNISSIGRARYGSSDPAFAAAEIQALIAGPLGKVDQMFAENLASPVSIVDEIGEFVARGGGKRVRPTLHLLSARLCDYRGPHDILLATVLEFIHCATLIHDDIIDEAKTRRGRPSVNAAWDNNVTVLFGDYLFAKAMEMALDAESLEVMQKLAEVTLRMTEGEMLQTRYAGRLDLSVDEYMGLVEKKTAALFGCCCELGGMLADEVPERRNALREYGLNLGLAFQLIDDMLDFTGDPAILGKPSANDLHEGKATLAVIELLADGPAEACKLAEVIMKQEGDDGLAIKRLNVMLEESGALTRTRKRASAYATRAKELIRPFDESPAKQAMLALPDLLLDRDR
jgi:octaprenyl-diphosphate synthase